ncbi:hypothetical protein GAO09_05250 [Rhizobiales bacterium RZME27]|jgi:hypothetical protein|uniref:Uncharacterized protein n=1 Tax=Endobacterium cereale TaxID=2663029 RepID=A0A6A8A6I6_9HYPH|nr:hypothetical protein [Endobacterium cereale]MQY45468.1 hypothetical protein [Endobacterium cereale]
MTNSLLETDRNQTATHVAEIKNAAFEGGAGTIGISLCAVNKTAFNALERSLLRATVTRPKAVTNMTLPMSKLGKTGKSIRGDSPDSCHGVSPTLG